MNRLRCLALLSILLPFKNNFHFKLYFIASIELRNMTSVVIADKVDEYNTFTARLLWWLQLKEDVEVCLFAS